MSEPNCPYCGAEVDTTDFFEFDDTETDRRDCNNCDDTDYSENVPLGTELAQNQIRSRYDEIIKEIDKKASHDFILNKHYAQRLPSISWCFGLFINDSLEGVLTIGKPASNSLCDGVCGVEYKSFVYELNRLIVNEGLPKNTLSFFVSSVLRILKKKI